MEGHKLYHDTIAHSSTSVVFRAVIIIHHIQRYRNTTKSQHDCRRCSLLVMNPHITEQDHERICRHFVHTYLATRGIKKKSASSMSRGCRSSTGIFNSGEVSKDGEKVPVSRNRDMRWSLPCQRFRNHWSKSSLSVSGTSTSRALDPFESCGGTLGLLMVTSPIGTSFATLKRRMCICTAGGGTPSMKIDRSV